MAVIKNPNLTQAQGLKSKVSPQGGNFTDTGIITEGAKIIAFQNEGATGDPDVIVTCAAAIATSLSDGSGLATWILKAGQSFNPPITDGCLFPQFEYDANGGSILIYVEY